MQYCSSQTKLEKAGLGTKPIYCLIEVGEVGGWNSVHDSDKTMPVTFIYFILMKKRMEEKEEEIKNKDLNLSVLCPG